ncbi:MAG: TonB-dependent receptor plug domain-containing protein [Bacteroidales bacterium]|nr:TonB-dependent receptor plug domain-containing protein [Bacteroidales bacterium]MBN2632408.1 TonB-dependent receptor plug domain-containing protein [Bacteroidales bacterium]
MKKPYLLTLVLLFLSFSLSAQNDNNSEGFRDDTSKVTSEPLVIINGEISSTGVKWLDPNSIESISILKDRPATEVYGEAGRNGVILVTIKDKLRSYTNTDRLEDISSQQGTFRGDPFSKALVIINGEVSSTGLKWINPDKIKSISVLKDKSATAVFGEAGKNGVIIVTADDLPATLLR